MCLWLLLTQLQTGGLIGYIQPNQTCWIVLLNILSPFLYQFSTKLAWSTRDVAELGSGRGGAAIIALHFTIIVFIVSQVCSVPNVIQRQKSPACVSCVTCHKCVKSALWSSIISVTYSERLYRPL